MLRLIFLATIFLPVTAFTQIEYGIKAGLNISDIVITNYINPDVESDLRLKTGLHAGLLLSGMVDKQFGLVAELLYADKGVNAISKIHLHYITAPLLVQYQLTDNIFAELGPELAYLFSARSKHGNVSATYNNKIDLSLDAGFRINTPKLFFGLRYCAGLFNVKEPAEKFSFSGNEKVKYQNRVLQLSVGYRIWMER